MKCHRIPSDEKLLDTCPVPATKRNGRRLYCAEHAPDGSVDLDRFVTDSAMTVEDKAREYDRIAEYLYKQGWEVRREGSMPDDGRVAQFWDHPESAARDIRGTHTLMSAYKVECFLDAPRPGPRFLKMMACLNEVMDKKQRVARIADIVESTSFNSSPEQCPYKDNHGDTACVDCGYTPSGLN